MIPIMMRINKAIGICSEAIGSENVKYHEKLLFDSFDNNKTTMIGIQVITDLETYHNLYDVIMKDFEPNELWFWCTENTKGKEGIVYAPYIAIAREENNP